MRALIATIKHETNTFSPITTDLARFAQWSLHHGDAARAAMADTAMPMGAYIRLAEEAGAQIITPIAAEAMPGGLVTAAAYARLCAPILEAVREGVDVALLDLHGAMVVEGIDDGEGALLAAMRRIDPALVIAVTCDFHANLTAAMVDNATALIGYKTYPHTDMAQVAEQVGRIGIAVARGAPAPVMAWGRLPLLSQTLCQGTDDEPMRSLIAACRAAEARGALGATLFGGFALSDVPHAGTAAVVIADSAARARSACQRILAQTWQARSALVYAGSPLQPALQRAASARDGTIALIDHADNCGSGGTQDIMGVIAAVLAHPLPDVVVAAVWDPGAVAQLQQAGEGAVVQLALGGKTDVPALGLTGQPLSVRGVVERLTDGCFTIAGPMYTGVAVCTGPTALLRVGSARIIVTSRHHEPWDAALLTMMGIDLSQTRYVLLKGRLHWRAGMGAHFTDAILLDGEGATTSDNRLLPYHRLSRPIYPLDPDAVWSRST